MTTNTTTEDKSVVQALDYTQRGIRRVTWEEFSFTIVGPYQVQVISESYGHLKEEHTYVVGIEERDGVLVPAECSCPGDVHHETDCTHKLAITVCGGAVVLEAAAEYEATDETSPSLPTSTGADLLRTDGGAVPEEGSEDPTDLQEPDRSECDCDDLRDDFPCWPCVRDGERDLPE